MVRARAGGSVNGESVVIAEGRIVHHSPRKIAAQTRSGTVFMFFLRIHRPEQTSTLQEATSVDVARTLVSP
jgi:hypothetical protein